MRCKSMGPGVLLLLSTAIGLRAEALPVEITLENLSPQWGQGLAPVWVAFHDGSFDLFDEGQPASRATELMAEDGLTGDPTGRVPAEFILAALLAGADPAKAPSVRDTIVGEFAASPAAMQGGIQDLLFFDRRENPHFGLQLPGESVSIQVDLDGDVANQRFFSFAGMLFPTNDAFIANDNPMEIPVYDQIGKFIGADIIVMGEEVWDAGTEINDEDPVNVPYLLENGLNSVDENGVVHRHPGLLPAGSGGIVDFQIDGVRINANANFSAPGQRIARITVNQVPEPSPWSLLTTSVVAWFLSRRTVMPTRCPRRYRAKWMP